MKEIKAFIHENRIADVVHALKEKGYRNLSIYEGKGFLQAVSERERHYAVELADTVIKECKLELLCEDDEVSVVVGLIQQFGQTGQREAGWVYVTHVDQAVPIGSGGK